MTNGNMQMDTGPKPGVMLTPPLDQCVFRSWSHPFTALDRCTFTINTASFLSLVHSRAGMRNVALSHRTNSMVEKPSLISFVMSNT